MISFLVAIICGLFGVMLGYAIGKESDQPPTVTRKVPEDYPSHEAYLASRGAIKPEQQDKFEGMLKDKEKP